MIFEFSAEARAQLEHWRHHDPAKLERIKAIMRSIEVDPRAGIGKPEPLRHQLAGWWSRRIANTASSIASTAQASAVPCCRAASTTTDESTTIFTEQRRRRGKALPRFPFPAERGAHGRSEALIAQRKRRG